jgi:hypothetical protein
LFEISSSKRIYHANKVEKIFAEKVSNSFPYIVRTTQNNGLRGYIIEDEIYANDKNTLSFAQDTFSVFYQKEKYFTGNKVKVLKAKFKNENENTMKYLTASFQKALNSFTWGVSSTIETIAKTKIKLPTKKNKIDFDFMETFITELEQERISKLENYLEVSGLKDYDLTDEEQKVLEDFENDKIEWGEKTLYNLFDINPTKYYKLKNDEIISLNGAIPLVSNSSIDNGVMGFSNLTKNNNGNTLTCSDTTLGAETMYYQKNDFIGYSHIQHLVPKFEQFNQNIAHFIVTSSKISTSKKYDYGTKFNREAMNKTKIQLPTKNNQPDYELMETLISAIQKQVIKDVVLYTNQKLNEDSFK